MADKVKRPGGRRPSVSPTLSHCVSITCSACTGVGEHSLVSRHDALQSAMLFDFGSRAHHGWPLLSALPTSLFFSIWLQHAPPPLQSPCGSYGQPILPRRRFVRRDVGRARPVSSRFGTRWSVTSVKVDNGIPPHDLALSYNGGPRMTRRGGSTFS